MTLYDDITGGDRMVTAKRRERSWEDDIFPEIPADLILDERRRKALENLDMANRAALILEFSESQGLTRPNGRKYAENNLSMVESDEDPFADGGYFSDDIFDPQFLPELKSQLSYLGYYDNSSRSDEQDMYLDKAVSRYSEDNNIHDNTWDRTRWSVLNSLREVKNPAKADFDGRFFRWLEKGQPILVLKAQSGLDDYQKKEYQDVPNKGPLPEGNYYIRQKNVQKVKNSFVERRRLGEAPGGYEAWGTKRVELYPFDSNEMYGRSGIFLHGGKEYGSAGCLDLGPNELKFFNLFEKYGRDLILKVHYDQNDLK